jgi:hypothetical protein
MNDVGAGGLMTEFSPAPSIMVASVFTFLVWLQIMIPKLLFPFCWELV